MSVSEALKLLRLETGLTQDDLALKLNKSFGTINRWENGKAFPSRSNSKAILELAARLDASQDCLNYLNDVLIPDIKRSQPATDLGFPDIDRDFLFRLADDSTNALYVIEAGTYNLLYANRKAEKFAACNIVSNGDRPLSAQKDKRCFHFFENKTSPCSFCPLSRLNTTGYTDEIIEFKRRGKKFRIHAKMSKINERDIYVIYLTDISDESDERFALYELTNDIPFGVGIYNVYFDERIELVFLNKEYYRMAGPERSEQLLKTGKTDYCLIHPDELPLLKAEIRNAIAKKRNVNIVINMKIHDNRFHRVSIEGRIIKIDSKKFTFYTTFHEIDTKNR